MAFALLLLMFTPQLWAATCTSVFNDPDGTSSNLQATGDVLDLGDVPFANNPWPASGASLASGDYFFSGANLGNNYRLNIAQDATVRIFVSGSLVLGNNLDLNRNGDPDQLLVVVNGSLTIGNGSGINGLVYATGSIGVGNNGVLEGGLAAGGSVGAGNNTVVDANYGGIADGLLAGLCQGPVELSANGQNTDSVVVNVGETVAFSVVATGCPAAEASVFSANWIDGWAENGTAFLQAGFSSSPCERAVEQNRTFSEAGSFTIQFESFYCGDSRFWTCGEYRLFGRDEITVEVIEPNDNLICEPDEFERSDLGPDWVTSVSSGGFTPRLVRSNGNTRLRMTQAVRNQATAATYQRLFPGSDNLIQIEFDYYAYGGSGADGLAVVFSDASVTPQAGGYGGSLGYAQEPDGSGGFAGGWLGIGLDEYGNFSNDSEGRVGGNFGRTLDSVAVRGAAPDYAYIADSGSLSPGIDAANDSNPFRYRITIDSRNGKIPTLLVERKRSGSGSGYTRLIGETLVGQPAIPENLFLSLTGSTGGANNIHELDNLQVCADKVGPVQALVDHFELDHSGSALTCRPEVITVRACDNADCSETFNDPVEVSLVPSGWVGGDTFTMTGGTASRALRVTTPGVITLGVSGSNPGTKAFSQTLCNNGTGSPGAADCDLTFFDSGFEISIPDHVSDTETAATIAAVRKDDTSERCVPGFDNETKDVSLWSSFVNPASGTQGLLIDGNTVPGSPSGTTRLSFDGNGEVTVPLRYPDAGRVRLNARYEGSGEDGGLVMIGNGDFVARPDHFNLSIPGNPAATSVATGNEFLAAGAEFEMRVSAINASGAVTPNFGNESPAEGVSVTSALVAPGGGDAPPLAGAFGAFGESCDGNTGQAGAACGLFSWPEVGIIRVTPSLTSGSYLGTGDVQGNAVSHVGRFIPDRFNVLVTEPGEVEPFCAGFAYTGQDLEWRPALEPLLTLEALNVQGDLTRNYTIAPFQRLSEGDLTRMPAGADRTAVNAGNASFPVNSSLEPGALTTIAPGRLQYRFSPLDRITYLKTIQSRVEPFTPSYRIELTGLQDADGVSSPQLPLAIDPVFGFEMRYGRLDLTNAYGPETTSLVVPFRTDYYVDSGFTANGADSCWAYDTGGSVTLDQAGLSGGTTSVDGAASTLVGGRPPSDKALVLAAPGEGAQGDVLATFSVPLWLQGDYDGDGALENPVGLATFGVYRGHDRIIYWRER